MLTIDDFHQVNFSVWNHDIDGGFFEGGTSVTINMQNSHKLFISSKDKREEWPISSLLEALDLANKHLSI